MDFTALIEWIKEIKDQLKLFHILDPYERGVRLRGGAFHADLAEGKAHWKIPVWDSILSQNIATTTMSVDPQSITTKDGKNVVVSCIIKYKVQNVRRFLLEVDDAVDAISDVTMGVVFDVISDMTWEEIMDSDISETVTEEVRRDALSDWGISVKKVTITDLAQIRSIRLIGGVPTSEE